MDTSHQQKKSALTRDRIVIATLQCIIEFGYESTSVAKIAKLAQLSTGAMQYHFQTKIEAIKAAIEYLHDRRLADRQRDMANMPASADPLAYGIKVYWQHLNKDHFLAYQELVIAARSHPELSAVLRPAYKKFLKTWRDDSNQQFPIWGHNQEKTDLVADAIQYLLEGLAYGRVNQQNSDKKTKARIQFMTSMMTEWAADNFDDPTADSD
jgi:AcrR family transcriptional regulator